MTDKTRIKIAAIVTALFLAGISTVGLATAKRESATVGTAAPAAATVQQPAAAPAAQLAGYREQDDGEREGWENASHSEREADE